MDERRDELLDEIRQVLEQYRKEVPSARRASPESIKRRVIELVSRGVKVSEISRRTKIPYYTPGGHAKAASRGHLKTGQCVS